MRKPHGLRHADRLKSQHRDAVYLAKVTSAPPLVPLVLVIAGLPAALRHGAVAHDLPGSPPKQAAGRASRRAHSLVAAGGKPPGAHRMTDTRSCDRTGRATMRAATRERETKPVGEEKGKWPRASGGRARDRVHGLLHQRLRILGTLCVVVALLPSRAAILALPLLLLLVLAQQVAKRQLETEQMVSQQRICTITFRLLFDRLNISCTLATHEDIVIE